jgi:hypothetical protein
MLPKINILLLFATAICFVPIAVAVDPEEEFPATIKGGDGLYKADVYPKAGKNRLAVDTAFESDDDIGAPVFSNNLKSIFADVNIALSPSAYTTIYSYSGSGKFVSFIVDYDKDDVITRLKIDGNTVFDLSATDIDNIQIPNSATVDFMGTLGGPWWDGTAKKLGYIPPFPISYSTSVLIEAKETADVIVDKYIVTLTQE